MRKDSNFPAYIPFNVLVITQSIITGVCRIVLACFATPYLPATYKKHVPPKGSTQIA